MKEMVCCRRWARGRWLRWLRDLVLVVMAGLATVASAEEPGARDRRSPAADGGKLGAPVGAKEGDKARRVLVVTSAQAKALALTWTRFEKAVRGYPPGEYEAVLCEEGLGWVVMWMPSDKAIAGGGMVFHVDRSGERILRTEAGW